MDPYGNSASGRLPQVEKMMSKILRRQGFHCKSSEISFYIDSVTGLNAEETPLASEIPNLTAATSIVWFGHMVEATSLQVDLSR